MKELIASLISTKLEAGERHIVLHLSAWERFGKRDRIKMVHHVELLHILRGENRLSKRFIRRGLRPRWVYLSP
jgi:hypothetical protein